MSRPPPLFSVLVGILSAGCVEAFGTDDPHDPGDALGTFHVTAKETQNSCGAGALGATATWEFDVKLAWGEGQIFWNSGGEIVVGALSEDRRSFEIATSVLMDMRTEEDAGKPPCSILRTDVAKGTLETSGESVSSFGGTLSYAFDPTADSDCTDLLGPETPVLAALPCSMTYGFTAPRTGD